MKFRLYLVFMLFMVVPGIAQEIPINGQIFMNPYYYNPAFAGFEDRPAMYFYRRQQWTGIEGAPVTTGVNFHTIFNEKITFAAHIANDQRSIFNTSKALFTFGYRAKFDDFHYLSFGLSGGIGFNNVDLDAIDPDDPVVGNALNNNMFLDGNAGFNYYNNGFNIGVSLPKIFKTDYLSDEAFVPGEISPLNDIIFMTSYRWEISENQLAVEPFLVYNYFKDLPGQFEVIGLLHLVDVFWIGASYRQSYGMTGYVGLNIKDNFKFGYGYEFFTDQLGSFNNGSHDIQLALVFGKKEKKGKINYIEQRRRMLESMGRTSARPGTNTTQIQPDPFATQQTTQPTYSDEDALRDLMAAPIVEEKVVPEPEPEIAPVIVQEPLPIVEEAPVPQFEEFLVPEVEEDPIPEIEEEPEPLFDFTFEEFIEPEPARVEPPARVPEPTPQVREPEPVVVPQRVESDEDELIRQMEETLTFDESEALTEAEDQLLSLEELLKQIDRAEETAEPSIDDKGVYIGPTTVTKGDHLLELDQGNYVVVGTFSSYRDAEEHSDKLFIRGFYTKFGYVSQTRIYYVYIFESDDLQECIDTSDRFKQFGSQFKENWVLQVK